MHTLSCRQSIECINEWGFSKNWKFIQYPLIRLKQLVKKWTSANGVWQIPQPSHLSMMEFNHAGAKSRLKRFAIKRGPGGRGLNKIGYLPGSLREWYWNAEWPTWFGENVSNVRNETKDHFRFLDFSLMFLNFLRPRPFYILSFPLQGMRSWCFQVCFARGRWTRQWTIRIHTVTVDYSMARYI